MIGPSHFPNLCTIGCLCRRLMTEDALIPAFHIPTKHTFGPMVDPLFVTTFRTPHIYALNRCQELCSFQPFERVRFCASNAGWNRAHFLILFKPKLMPVLILNEDPDESVRSYSQLLEGSNWRKEIFGHESNGAGSFSGVLLNVHLHVGDHSAGARLISLTMHTNAGASVS